MTLLAAWCFPRKGDEPLVIPEGAVVVAGSRAITSGKGKEWGVSLYTPVIVKYRDEKTDARVQLEELASMKGAPMITITCSCLLSSRWQPIRNSTRTASWCAPKTIANGSS